MCATTLRALMGWLRNCCASGEWIAGSVSV
jgi:hypothetical protein